MEGVEKPQRNKRFEYVEVLDGKKLYSFKTDFLKTWLPAEAMSEKGGLCWGQAGACAQTGAQMYNLLLEKRRAP